ncbi:hypothetical protein MG290_01660 [Flavobacterium sp. CBA20B-1]|uniref:hypothetical protein n=1 Tax=unclassified Flavobacterium TaxID=196869 RepID=UPI0022240FC6|nr:MULTISPECIES: hypothetical protein [unclassified Flavobacterium]WCM42402.1 hypothetical protein MG290_01660 [Flavobacterium sp. CBA20B-1]
MGSYKGITFAEGYNKSFADFKKEFASTHVFKNIPENKREAELKKAYQIATKANRDGNAKTGTKDSQTDPAK